jgi:pimeloyl-ACP methyl ester carboxylesterase
MHALLLGLMLSTATAAPPAAQAFGVTQSEWLGYTRYDFVVAGQPALLIVPREAAPGRPWVWRAEWFGERHGPQVALALLARGWHYAYINASDRYGGPEAMRIFDAFYQHLLTHAQLAPRMVLEGFSRGGLYAFNFAAIWPERVAALYLDAPPSTYAVGRAVTTHVGARWPPTTASPPTN